MVSLKGLKTFRTYKIYLWSDAGSFIPEQLWAFYSFLLSVIIVVTSYSNKKRFAIVNMSIYQRMYFVGQRAFPSTATAAVTVLFVFSISPRVNYETIELISISRQESVFIRRNHTPLSTYITSPQTIIPGNELTFDSMFYFPPNITSTRFIFRPLSRITILKWNPIYERFENVRRAIFGLFWMHKTLHPRRKI